MALGSGARLTLWRPVEKNPRFVATHNGFYAPSWSWVHVKGPVSHERLPLTTTYFDLNSYRVDPATIDPTGAVSTGILDFNVPIFPMGVIFERWNVTFADISLLDDESHKVTARVFLYDRTASSSLMGLAFIGSRKERIDSQFCTVTFYGIVVDENLPRYKLGVSGLSRRVGYWTARFNERFSSPYSEAVMKEQTKRLRLL
jgi:hypothetical protein